MAKLIKGEVAGLNIRIHPHSEDLYRDLFRTAFAAKKIVNLRGNRSAIITSLTRIGKDDRYVNGVLTTFLDFDLDVEWLDTSTLQEASDNEVQKVIIPDHLRPDMITYYFRFDVKNHELVFEHYNQGKRLTHQSARKFFEGLFKYKRISKKFGDVKVTLIQTKGGLDAVFSIPRITNLEVYIEQPNSDLWDGDFEDLVEKHLEDKSARSMKVIYVAEQGTGIERDKDLEALVRTSIRNGRTVAKGYGPHGHETVTTDKFPKVVQDKFDPDLGESTIFQSLADRFRN